MRAPVDRRRCNRHNTPLLSATYSAVPCGIYEEPESRDMKIHGLCIIKNEADVIEESLVCAVHWCDYIYVFDNGSSDGTWELVRQLANQHPQIVPYKRDNVLFRSALRADIFNAFRSNAGPQDWWCRLDADEFYIDDPRIFLTKVPGHLQTVWSASLNYYFTDEDAIAYRQDPGKFLATPVQQRLRYYLNNWGELRFFRHSDDIVWTRTHDSGGFPGAMFTAPAYPVRIWLRHYQYRSPEQIERRLLTRRQAMEANTGFLHEVTPNWSSTIATRRGTPLEFEGAGPEFAGSRWQERIVPAASLDFDAFDRRYIVNETLMPEFPVRLSRADRIRAVIPQALRPRLGRLRRKIRLPFQRPHSGRRI
jgi:Glycosyl transferase family 2